MELDFKVAPLQVDFAENARASKYFGKLVDGQQRVAVRDYRFVDLCLIDKDSDCAVWFVCNDLIANLVGFIDLLEHAVGQASF